MTKVSDGRTCRRVDFSPQDDFHLAQYLALKVPIKERGGRSGNKLYKDVVEFAIKVCLISPVSISKLMGPS